MHICVYFLTVFAISASVLAQLDKLGITNQCLGCICYGASMCETRAACKGDVCGPFRITIWYWLEVDKPLLNQSLANASEDERFKDCALSTKCSILTVTKYMDKFPMDCNGDGRIDCDDYALIHNHGYSGCNGAKLPVDFEKYYNICKTKLGGLPHFIPVETIN